MAEKKHSLNNHERIVFIADGIRHGRWSAYTHMLVITNQAVILEEYELSSGFKRIIKYPFSEIIQAIVGSAPNGEKQLELYLSNGDVEDFAPQDGDVDVLKTIVMAIKDQQSPEADNYDYNYYQTIMDESAEEEIKCEARINKNPERSDVQVAVEFAGAVAKNVLKSGDFSLRGVQKGIKKASKKQARKNIMNVVMNGPVDDFLDDMGVYDIQDCFTEMGNDFREMFGLPHKMTHEERRALQKKAERQQKAELAQKKKAKQSSNTSPSSSKNKRTKMSINEQLDALKKLKELMDAGVLTQEEFDKKKQEIITS